MQGTQYATKRSILCRGAFCGPTMPQSLNPLYRKLNLIERIFRIFEVSADPSLSYMFHVKDSVEYILPRYI